MDVPGLRGRRRRRRPVLLVTAARRCAAGPTSAGSSPSCSPTSSGFTTLSETRDPEQVKNLVDRCFERLVADIDALRRPGRQDRRRRHRRPVRRAGRPRGRRRAGGAGRAAHAGDARRRTPPSSAPPIAAARRRQHRRGARRRAAGRRRLHGHGRRGEHRAAPRRPRPRRARSLVGPATYAATGDGHRATTSSAPLDVKGREEPVEAWVADAALPCPRATGRAAADAPLVGRDAELALLDHADRHRRHAPAGAARCCCSARPAWARAGWPRSWPTTAECDHGAVVLEGRCVPYGEANVWWPVAEALRQACGHRRATSTPPRCAVRLGDDGGQGPGPPPATTPRSSASPTACST